MSNKHYLRSDGNGGYNISKSLMVTIATFMLILISTIFVSAMNYGALEQKVDNIDNYIESVGGTNKETISAIETKVDSNKIDIEVITEHIRNTDKTLESMSSDIKEILKEIK